MSFENLNLNNEILKALKEEGYTKATPIQEKAIPIVLQGRDLLGCAQTGTGKTAAFAIPIIQTLSKQEYPGKNRPVRCLIVTPTRELAIQIDESIKAYGRHSRLSHTVIFGGVKQHAQTNSLQKGIDILVATPGRLLDLMQQGFITLKHIEIFVLDEADRMLDMGFIHDVKKLIAALPQKRQTLFFSATMPPEIVKLSNSILSNPAKVEVTPVSSTAETIRQQLYYVDKGNKNSLLLELLKNEKIKTVLVFTRTKHGADKIVKVLIKNNIKAQAIHGNKAQNARQAALNNFKAGSTRVLVATDIAARGIDVDELEYVINFDIPNISETYVHRIGRTGRAGNKGTAISFCDSSEKTDIRNIEKLISMKIPVVDHHPFPMTGTAESSAEKPVHAQGHNRPRTSQAPGNKPRRPEGRHHFSDKRRNKA